MFFHTDKLEWLRGEVIDMSEGPEKDRIDLGFRDVQGVIALTVTGGFLAIGGYALTKAGSITDVLSVLQIIAAPASLIIGFYFGKKAAE